MARPLRLEHVGAIWHVTARGNARADIVYDDTDRQVFVDIRGRVATVSRWRLHAWVLITANTEGPIMFPNFPLTL